MADNDKQRPSDDDDVLAKGRKAFERCVDAEDHNRVTALEDLRFVRLGEQWPDNIRKMRERQKRPCLTINRLPAVVRQVVNDARQNKPSIKVHPVDSVADVEVAKVMDGLIRAIEYQSSADVAYDTAVECAVTAGFGYFRIGMDYAYDDTFDMDLTIERIGNPFAVYGDPMSRAADSSDWNVAFIVDRLSKEDYKAQYGDKAMVDFNNDAWSEAGDVWLNQEGVLVAEWWTREHVEKEVLLLSDGRVVDEESIERDEELQVAIQAGIVQVVEQRTTKSCKVRQVIMSGVDVLKVTDWPGKYIPIVPVYGEEFDIEGKRYFRSLIHQAKDSQTAYNVMRSTSVEVYGLTPRVPFIGPKNAFATDSEKWATVNTHNHPYIEYDGQIPPQRQPLDAGPAVGAIQEAMNAAEDIKAITGIYDASLGARSNETSGKAIMARQREGDTSTFHFIDNLSRAIRHAGRILIDLIPKVYTTPRIIRTLGEDGTDGSEAVNQPVQEMDENGKPMVDERGEAIIRMRDLTLGKYDLTVTTGPSFTTRREEAAAQMTEMIRAYPAIAPLIGDIMARNLDWPGADEIAERLAALNPLKQQQQIPPEVQQAMEQGQMLIQQLQQENEQLKADLGIEQEKNQIGWFNAETSRMKVFGDIDNKAIQAARPTPPPRSAR